MTKKGTLPLTQESGTSRPRHSRKLAVLLAGVGLVVCLASGRVEAAEYYVSPSGSDSAAGSMSAPFATLQKGNDVAAAGDTVWLRGGTYMVTKQIKITKSGTSDANRVKFFGYPGETAIIDFSGYVSTNTAADVPQILVTGNWIHMKGFEIANGKVQSSGSHSNSALRTKGVSNNTFELLHIHHHFGPGLFIDGGMGGNLILNCDSHHNYDKNGSQGDGENGDGFGVHYQETGPSTIIRGCRAWYNSDDGYDLISQEVPVRVENSWAIENGYPVGNGNGFKMGSSKTGIRHIVTHNVAWKNKAAGFYANHSSGGNNWYNNTAYMNGTQYNMLASPANDSGTTIILTGALAHKMRNNVGFPNKNTNMGGVDTMFNTWDLGITDANASFVSTSDTGYLGPRQADGSIPNIDFMKPKAGGPLVDKGTNVQLPYAGSAPDLGAYEYGAVQNPGTGGSTVGSGGSTGSGGGMGSGGGSASGGRAGTGGTNGSTGGMTSSGGSGTVGSGGAPGTGGSVAGSGGSTPGSGGTGTGGSSNSGTGGKPSGTGGQGTGAVDSTGGCSCAMSSPSSNHGDLLAMASLAALGLLLSRRRHR